MNKFVVTLLACIPFCGAYTVSAEDGQNAGPEHDDAGAYQPVPTGSDAANCQNGVSSGYACKNIEMLSNLRLEEMGGGTGADSWGWEDEENERYYALMARSTGVSFVDVTDPEAPKYLGSLLTPTGNQPWRDVKTFSNHAFVVADNIPGHGMQVFDLTRLRGITSPQVFSADARYMEFGPAHNIAINEQTGFAYVTGSDTCEGGLHVIDIRNPKAPQMTGCFSADGYTHDAHCVSYTGPDPEHEGAETCFASNEDSLTIVDVSNKTNPALISRLEYPGASYAHQGWLTDDHRHFILGDELDERDNGSNIRTRVFNVEDLDAPVYNGAHIGSNPTIDHNLYVRGPYLFQANYQAGLRILLMEDLEQAKMREVGFFDTFPLEDSREFAGAWNVYPFFDNGTILVSDMQRGLFVLRAGFPGAEAVSSPINGQLSGAWLAENLNDQGLILFVGENSFGPFMFFSWFVYRDGQPFWIVGDAPFDYGTDSVEIQTQRLEGLELLIPSDAQATRIDIGTTTIHRHDCNTIHVNYEWGGLGSGELEMTRFASVEGRQCAEDGTQD
jgi:choice-of-anchor B domain-containing protein